MTAFSGKAFVVRVDEATAHTDDSTFISDLSFLAMHDVRPIVIAPNAPTARELVRWINRSGNQAVGLNGADAAMLPGNGNGLGKVQAGILQTLTQNGYIPVIEPTAFGVFGDDVALAADDVAQAIACATDAVRAIFFHALGGVTDAKTAELIHELTAAEALEISEESRLPHDLRAAIRAAALGVRAGVGAAQIVDGRVAHAAIVEVLTARHLGTQVTGGVYTGG
ncbi:MAG: acetylglutamate kinase [Vulcanimicrobiaceae bacterium]